MSLEALTLSRLVRTRASTPLDLSPVQLKQPTFHEPPPSRPRGHYVPRMYLLVMPNGRYYPGTRDRTKAHTYDFVESVLQDNLGRLACNVHYDHLEVL